VRGRASGDIAVCAGVVVGDIQSFGIAGTAAAAAGGVWRQGRECGDPVGDHEALFLFQGIRYGRQKLVLEVGVAGRVADIQIVGPDQSVVGQAQLAVAPPGSE
jgi:hypothetical protein